MQFFDGLVLNDPEQEFLDTEIQNITEWVENGGTLYVFAEDALHNNIPSINELIGNFGMELANESFFDYDSFGLYTSTLDLDDKASPLFADASNIHNITFKNPIEVISNSSNVTLLCKAPTGKATIGLTHFGRGRVIVIGDNDVLKENYINLDDNLVFAKQILKWGQSEYFESEITSTPTSFPMNEYGYVDFNILNHENLQEKGYLNEGFLFMTAFFYENGDSINAQMYGLDTPVLPMFPANGSHYNQYIAGEWYGIPGDYYILILIDHPAVASELFYIRFSVYDAEEEIPFSPMEISEPEYGHLIDIIGILGVVHMGLLIWYYNFEKYKKRLQIITLEGDTLNLAKSKLSEGNALLKVVIQGMERDNFTDMDKLRYILEHRKRLKKYLRDLKGFGDSIGE